MIGISLLMGFYFYLVDAVFGHQFLQAAADYLLFVRVRHVIQHVQVNLNQPSRYYRFLDLVSVLDPCGFNALQVHYS